MRNSLPLSEKVRIEIFIPDSLDIAYRDLLEELGAELSYAFGGCTQIAALGKYRSLDDLILPDQINILFFRTYHFCWSEINSLRHNT